MSTRIIYLDVIKCFAIVFVVGCHASLLYKGDPSLTTNVIHYINMVISHLGVPLFLMVSGVLLYQKKLDSLHSIKYFYYHNLMPILAIGEIWAIVYFFINPELEHSMLGGGRNTFIT